MTVVREAPTNTPGTVDAYIANSADLLRTIAEVLDVRTIFPRLSEIANRILPHDALAIGFVGGDGQLVTGDAFLDMAQLFDGSNEQQFIEALERRGLVHRVFDRGGNCRLA